ncbi:MAG: hypothetical protein EAZ92_03320 [Candidatus Kapaibacterium sp.]|nr:MAG: hypothetical protein EAZ92_03320 [Candidatus Kapabacteria bacterium]
MTSFSDFAFSAEDIHTMSAILGATPHETDGEYLFTLANTQTRQSLTLNVSNNVDMGDDTRATLVIAQTQHGYFELHSCTVFMVFEPDELIFISEKNDLISGLIVGKQCTCSMFTNVRRHNLSADFTDLDPRLLMSSMQLSVAEAVLV